MTIEERIESILLNRPSPRITKKEIDKLQSLIDDIVGEVISEDDTYPKTPRQNLLSNSLRKEQRTRYQQMKKSK